MYDTQYVKQDFIHSTISGEWPHKNGHSSIDLVGSK